MKRAMIARLGAAALLGVAIRQIGPQEEVAEIEAPRETKYETRQLRRAAEKRARKMAKQASRRINR